MNREELDFVIAVLPKGRTVFYDYPDRFAVLLLIHHLGAGKRPIAALKTSAFAPLLNKSVIRDVLAKHGAGELRAEDLAGTWPAQADGYRLTLGSWPDLDTKPRRAWHQVTRAGYSLVLQLNLPRSHTRSLARSIEDWRDYTSEGLHPVASDELTLAWARIDLDLSRGEALIEEIQSDWVRDVRMYAAWSDYENASAWQTYWTDYLAPRTRHWPRTIMTATLWFLLEELGIRTIFYHSYETGKRLKQIKGSGPPRSLYTDLPRSFCFRTTHNGPAFLRDSKDRQLAELFSAPETLWYVHTFPDPGDSA
ncbi:MAG: hypothetical protein AAF513_14395 [Pseudomonadota bacterium]